MKSPDLSVSHWTSKITGGHSLNVPNGIKIVHLPTGIVVTCDEYDSAHRNKVKALASLEEKLLERNAELSEVIVAADALESDTVESFEQMRDRVSRPLGPAPANPPLDARNMAAGTHCWALLDDKLVVVIKSDLWKGVTDCYFYVCGGYKGSVSEKELTLLEVIARPLNHLETELLLWAS